jgi:hypothetical protein
VLEDGLRYKRRGVEDGPNGTGGNVVKDGPNGNGGNVVAGTDRPHLPCCLIGTRAACRKVRSGQQERAYKSRS